MSVYYSFIPMSDKMQIYKKERKMRNDLIILAGVDLHSVITHPAKSSAFIYADSGNKTYRKVQIAS